MAGDLQSQEGALRDRLAVYRTVMANERTLLSYTRTAMAIGVVGVTLLQFADNPKWRAFGLACVPLGMVLMALGLWRYGVMRRRIASPEDGPNA